MTLQIRALQTGDASLPSNTFTQINWTKSDTRYDEYLSQHNQCRRIVRVVTIAWVFVGHVTITSNSTYAPFRDANIPEIQDLIVLPRIAVVA